MKSSIAKPVSGFALTFDDEALVAVELSKSFSDERETPLSKKTKKELTEYLDGKRESFDVPIKPMGTEFQEKVWRALCDIPYGEVRTYKDIAEAVGSPRGFRAVGLANNRNPLMIVVPCHRVIGANGKLVGYAGGLDMKTSLLALEGAVPNLS